MPQSIPRSCSVVTRSPSHRCCVGRLGIVLGVHLMFPAVVRTCEGPMRSQYVKMTFADAVQGPNVTVVLGCA